MAVKLSANYSKKLGLPGFSSHSFSASVEVELTDLSQVEAECQKLYQLLQQSVDHEIQQVGFVPGEFYGIDAVDQSGNNGHRTGHAHGHTNGHARNGNGRGNSVNGHSRASNGNASSERWNCTDGQRGFILRLVNEHNLDKQGVEDLARQFFGIGVRELNKMQASQLLDELLAKVGQPRQTHRRRQPSSSQHEPAVSS
ncbi:hypothetical protein DES53_111139 [Roseimicrobium gellanilyticum]|uniref:Uncharacterized protein n=1 Tax=Roseimicrobium gellanilyticum TaxID=748857 RepID=A0A366H8R9_9BACT|nr:hypothetical protein [Roseimicrobium gellanilyticum]RBP38620.1 hypothetical protein DES53_111139 [Roseimicrobium gellanilyticum]